MQAQSKSSPLRGRQIDVMNLSCIVFLESLPPMLLAMETGFWGPTLHLGPTSRSYSKEKGVYAS